MSLKLFMENNKDILKDIVQKVDRIEPNSSLTNNIMLKILESKHYKSYSQSKPILSKKQIYSFSLIPIMVIVISFFNKSESTKLFVKINYLDYINLNMNPIYAVIALSLFMFFLLDYYIKVKFKL